MTNYKQNEVPQIKLIWNDKTVKELRDLAFEHGKKHSGKTVINTDIKIPIQISVSGIRKTSFGGSIYQKKAELVRILPQLLRVAKYNNFGQRKESDSDVVLGYLNFSVKCRIDGIIEKLRLAVRFQKGGKYHYNLEVNKKNTPKKARR